MTDIRRISTHQEGEIPMALEEIKGRRPGRRPAQIGYLGIEIFGDLITGDLVEHNRDWIGKNRFKLADRMRKGDATCAATLMAITLPIVSTDVQMSTTHGHHDERPDPIVEEAADFIQWNLLEGMEESFDGWLREVMLFLAYGHYVFEKVFTEVKSGPYKGAVGWKEFAPRHPSTFEQYRFNRNGHLESVEQQAMNPATNNIDRIDLPYDKLMWFTNQKEAGNPLGVSVLRPAYKHWKYKDGFYAVQAIAVERQGAGVPYGKYPGGAIDDDIDALEETLQNLQAHEQSYLTYEDGWEVGFVDMGSSKILDPKDAIEHHDQMIPKSILAGFLNLTQGDRGSFALSSDSSGFFTYSIQQTANYVAGVINKHIRELCDINYPNLPDYPKVKFSKVGHISLDKIIDGIQKLGALGFITPTMELENHIRALLNLQPIDETVYEEAQKEEEEKLAQMAANQQQGTGESKGGSGKDDK